jgi:hypothetical protein
VRNKVSDTWADVTDVLPFPTQFLVNADVFGLGESDPEHLPLWGGQAIGRIADLPWAADVVTDTVRQAVALLDRRLDVRG